MSEKSCPILKYYTHYIQMDKTFWKYLYLYILGYDVNKKKSIYLNSASFFFFKSEKKKLYNNTMDDISIQVP